MDAEGRPVLISIAFPATVRPAIRNADKIARRGLFPTIPAARNPKAHVCAGINAHSSFNTSDENAARQTRDCAGDSKQERLNLLTCRPEYSAARVFPPMVLTRKPNFVF